MKHFMKLNPEPFEMIKSGNKTIELRLNDEKRRNITIGDLIEFINTENSDNRILTKVIAIYRFNTFEELYKHIPLDKIGYLKDEVSDAKASDMEKYYSVKQQEKYGVIGIALEVVRLLL